MKIPDYGVYIISLMVLLCCPSSHAEPVSSQNLPIMRINADALPSIDIGITVGRNAKARFPDIESRYDRHLSQIINPLSYDKALDSLPTLLKNIDQEYQEELQGVASTWSLTGVSKLGDGLLSFDEYILLNLLPDIGFAPNGSGFAVMGKAAETGAIVGRNLDWESTPELRSLQAISVYQYKDKTIVNIGFAGIISTLSGFNDQGLFLSTFNAELYTPYTQTAPKTAQTQANIYPLAFAVRRVLETSHSVTQAGRRLSQNNYAFDSAIMMADQKSIQVLEYAKQQKWGIRTWRSRTHKPWGRALQIAVIDCHMLAKMPNNCQDPKDNYHWLRLRKLAEFSPAQPANEQQLTQIMSDTANKGYELFNQTTLQSMIFIPATAELYLYAASSNRNNNPNSTLSSVAPIYQPYLDLLPTSYRQKTTNTFSSFSLFIGLLVLGLIGLTMWVIFPFSKEGLLQKILKKKKD